MSVMLIDRVRSLVAEGGATRSGLGLQTIGGTIGGAALTLPIVFVPLDWP